MSKGTEEISGDILRYGVEYDIDPRDLVDAMADVLAGLIDVPGNPVGNLDVATARFSLRARVSYSKYTARRRDSQGAN